jgi:aspartyl-tRNA(Asn)/glutamyl-tRNA(Gln) amidotransferase subunit C
MEINTALISQLAHLSRLRFDDNEKEAFRADLEKMVAFVEKLREVDTTGVEPLLHMGDRINSLREDKVEGMVTREEALLNSPVNDAVFFKVPTVIKK